MSAGVAMWVETQVLLQVHWLLAEFSFLDFQDWGPMYLQTVSQDHSQLLEAAAAKSRQSCPTLCHPVDGSPQAPPSLGFSRQEHWSGLPFPSPMHESEKWKESRSVVSNSLRPHGLQPTRLPRPWDLPGKSTGVGCHCLLPLRGYSFTKEVNNIPISLRTARGKKKSSVYRVHLIMLGPINLTNSK